MTIDRGTRSAHHDTFCRDHLPPQAGWPELIFELPELRYPQRLNAAVELLDAVIARLGADRPCLHAADGTTWSYGEVRARVDAVAHVLVTELGLVPGNRVLL